MSRTAGPAESRLPSRERLISAGPAVRQAPPGVRLRVLVADDAPMVRAGLRSIFIRGGHQVVGEAADGREAVRLALQTGPDVVLMDVSMPVVDGLEALQELRQAGVTVPVVLITAHSDPEQVIRAITLGAEGYLLKDIEPQRLAEAVRKVAQGDRLFQAEEIQQALGSLMERERQPTDPWGRPLSRREIDVLAQLARGLSNRAIGQALGISPGTVANHIHRLVKRLGVADRTQAAVWAVRNGLDPPT